MKVLILGGGGTLGAFSAGALHALERKGFVPDAMIGSSAGGINMLRWMVGGAKPVSATSASAPTAAPLSLCPRIAKETWCSRMTAEPSPTGRSTK